MKKYVFTVFNILTKKQEEVCVSEEVYNAYRRTLWNSRDRHWTSLQKKSISLSNPYTFKEKQSGKYVKETGIPQKTIHGF